MGNSYVVGNNIINISGGQITCYVYGKLANLEEFNVSKNFYTNWSVVTKN